MIRKVLALLFIFQITATYAAGDFLSEIEKAGTVINTYENLTCQAIEYDGGDDFQKEWSNICDVVVKSDLCKEVDKNELVDCSDQSENDLNVKSFKFVKNCGIGFFYESLKEFVIFLKDMTVGIGSFIFDGEYRQEVADQAGEYWDSLQNYVAIEYAKEFDRTGSKTLAMANVGKNLISLCFQKMGDAIAKSYYRLGCYNQAKRQEKMCQTLGEFVMPPAVALGLIFKGPALVKKLFTASKKMVGESKGTRLALAKREDAILRKELEKIPDEEIGTPELNGMIDDLTLTMQKEGGVGIAANQVGKCESSSF